MRLMDMIVGGSLDEDNDLKVNNWSVVAEV